jgi:hypothetical protein
MYELVVGSLGSVFKGADKDIAYSHYFYYVESSRSGITRAAGEAITLFHNEEVVAYEFQG